VPRLCGGENGNLVLKVSPLIANNANEDIMAPIVVSGGVRFGGSLESGGRFFIGALGTNLALVSLKVFPNLNYFIKKCI
jgi:hypothetical protein